MNMILDSFVPLQFNRLPEDEMLRRSAAYYHEMDQRRTVREFSDEPVPLEVLKNIIQAAGTAPSGAHMQPWFFGLIIDPNMKKRVREAAEKEEKESYESRMSEEWLDDLAKFGTDSHKEYLEVAPALIAVFRENYRIQDGERKKNYYVSESSGIAAGILISAIHTAGLVTLTHTPSPMGFLNELLERPKNEVPFLLMPIGYPKPDTRVPDLKRKDLSEILRVY